MKTLRSTAAVALALMLALPGSALADTRSSVTGVELDAALGAATASEDAARAQIRTLLARDEVREIAAQAGLDLRAAEGAVETLEGDELVQLAAHASAAEADLAGGQTVTISLVSALLIIIIVILIVD